MRRSLAMPSAPEALTRFVYQLRHVDTGRRVSVEHVGHGGPLNPVTGFDADLPFESHADAVRAALSGGSGPFELEYYSVTHR
jgi:hypothetical protein